MKKLLILFLLFSLLLSFVACSGVIGNADFYSENADYMPSGADALSEEYLMLGEAYNKIEENPFYYTQYVNKSYFSMDSFTASYSNLRRYIEQGQALNSDIIKTDELINYFDYHYSYPTNGDTFLATSEIADAPWNTANKLLTVAVTTKEVDLLDNQGRNFVFLIDISGSMSDDNKLPLVRQSINLLVDELSDSDTISIVTYASGVETKADGLKGSEKAKIKNVVKKLDAGGATAGADGLDRAYALAEKHFISGGNNRIIIFSDGDFNVGTSSQEGIEALISAKRETGIYLTCLGYGMGNYRDTTMETLAKNGNGGYAYIDSLKEAKKVLVTDLNKTMVTVSKDTKAQMAFNPDVVSSYRLIGYENKLLTEEEFNDESADAGEIGSGHTSVVCYEVELKADAPTDASLYDLEIRYKDPTTDASSSYTKSASLAEMSAPVSEDHTFVSALVAFSLLLRHSPYRGQVTYAQVADLLAACGDLSSDELKAEFVTLFNKARSENLVSDPNYAEICSVTLGCGSFYTVYYHKRGTVLDLDKMLRLTGADTENYAYEFYYDMAYTEPYTAGVVSASINLFLKVSEK